MKKQKTEVVTIAEYNDQMMEDAYNLLAEAMEKMRKATDKIDQAMTEIIRARVDE